MSDAPRKIARDGVIIGEFTQIQITEGLKAGLIKPSDHLWDDKSSQWLRIYEIDHFNREKDEALGLGLKFIGYFALVLLGPGLLKYHGKYFSPVYKDASVLNWTGVAIILALLLYVLSYYIRASSGRHFWTGYVLVFLAVGLTGVTQTATVQKYWSEKSPFRSPLKYEVWGDFGEETFPSFELAFARLNMSLIGTEKSDPLDADEYNQSKQGSSIGVRLFDVKKGDVFEVTINSSDYRIIDKSTYIFTAKNDAEHALVFPDISYNHSKLRENKQTIFFNLQTSVKRNKGNPLVKTRTWQLRQINDCLISAKCRTLLKNGATKLEPVFIGPLTLAGFVNENHPAISTILAEALETGFVQSFSGTQSNSDEKVLYQLMAIWTALEKRGINYSSITTTTSSASKVQHVRLIEDTLSSSQANCVDGSTLFASIAYKVGIKPYLALSPGHCYVAFELPSGKIIGIEMTAIGRKTFAEAIEIATSNSKSSLTTNWDKFQVSDPDTGYVLINIADCRKLGVQPIPASSK
jgi:hypothetical protein